MSILSRILAWFRPAPVAPTRRLRCVCDVCGKDIAVIASSGKLWRHTCANGRTLDSDGTFHPPKDGAA